MVNDFALYQYNNENISTTVLGAIEIANSVDMVRQLMVTVNPLMLTTIVFNVSGTYGILILTFSHCGNHNESLPFTCI